MDTKFKYEVHPRIPIRTLIPKTAITRPTQLDLTKDEVILCLRHGPVYRVFDRTTQVQATLYNLDELHVAKYNAPKTTGFVDPAKKTTVCESIVIPKKETEQKPAMEEPAPVETKEEVVEEPTVVEEPEEVPAEEPAVEEAPVIEEVQVEEPAVTEDSTDTIKEIIPFVEESVPEETVVDESEEAVKEEPVIEETSTEEVQTEEQEESADESVEADEEDEEDDVESEDVQNGQPNNQYHPQRKKKKHH